MHKYTQEEFEFIDDRIEGRTAAEMTALFNAHFSSDLKVSQIKAFIKNNGLESGVDYRFQPGQVPFNKGKKGIVYPGGVATQFKKGARPENWMPVGSERINADGYVDVKISDTDPKPQKRWRGKHILIWEAAHGPVPPGHVVIFGDGNNRNFDPNNLLLITRAQLVRMNQSHLIQNDVELTRTGIIIADVYNKIGERRRTKRGDGQHEYSNGTV
jgi:hypothetical protein